MDEGKLVKLIRLIITRTAPRQGVHVLHELEEVLRKSGVREEWVQLAHSAADSAAELRSMAIRGSSFSREEMEAVFEISRELNEKTPALLRQNSRGEKQDAEGQKRDGDKAELFVFYDDCHILAGDTLLLYSIQKQTAAVPSRLGGRTVRRVGRHAFYTEKMNDVHLFFEDGIEEIGEQDFGRALTAIRLPRTLKKCGIRPGSCPLLQDMRISCRLKGQGAMHRLSAASENVGEFYIVRDVSAISELKELAVILNLHLFSADKAGSSFFSETVFIGDERAGYEIPQGYHIIPGDRYSDDGSFRGVSAMQTENAGTSEAAAVRELIGRGAFGCLDPVRETRADWVIRSRALIRELVRPSAILCFTQEDLRASGWDLLAVFSLKTGYFFYPQLQKVITGKDRINYIYSRIYPSDGEMYRIDLAVLDGDGNPDNSKNAEEAFAKYRLLSLI